MFNKDQNQKVIKLPIVPFNNDDFKSSGEMVLTVEKTQRITLNRPLQRYLGTEGKPIKLYLGYDPVNKRIAIAKPDVVRLTDHRPVNFNKSGTVSARKFLDRFQIEYKDGPYHYLYDGNENGWLTFRLHGYKAPDQPTKD